MKTLKIALLQHNPTIANVWHNYHKIEKMIRNETSRGFDLFVAPELALLGYSPRDLLSQPELLELERLALDKIRLLSEELGVGILLGHSEKREGPGKPLFNACTLFEKGYSLGRIRKRRIPYYDVFSEERFFESAEDLPQEPLNFRGFKLGVFICEDAWWEVKKFGNKDISQPHWTLSLEKQLEASDILINLSASPFGAYKYDRRNYIFSHHAIKHKAPLLFSTCVGAQDEIIFDGPSFAMSSSGELLFEAKSFEEDIFRVELDQSKTLRSLDSLTVPEPENTWDATKRALVLGIKDFVNKNNFSKVIVGLSGGIDSALVAYLACEALGSDQVLGVSLPTQFNSLETRNDAQQLAKNLGIEFREIAIENLVHSSQTLLEVSSSGLVYENLQSRIRGLVLMTLSANEQRLLLATGNKSEFAMGYSTLYGDMCGALAPIGDLYKTEVFGLCYWIQSKNKNIFPQSLLSRPPSAELAPNQKDSDSLPDYAVLDVVLQDMIDNQFLNRTALERFVQEYSKHSLEVLKNKMFGMEFKRYQAPPVLKIHARSFGQGWQMPLVKSFSSQESFKND